MERLKIYITPEQYETALKNGISKDTLEQRVRKHGWSVERAIKESITKYGDWHKVAKKNGIGQSTFYARIRLGWDPKKAATQKTREFKKKSYLEEFDEIAAAHGVDVESSSNEWF